MNPIRIIIYVCLLYAQTPLVDSVTVVTILYACSLILLSALMLSVGLRLEPPGCDYPMILPPKNCRDM